MFSKFCECIFLYQIFIYFCDNSVQLKLLRLNKFNFLLLFYKIIKYGQDTFYKTPPYFNFNYFFSASIASQAFLEEVIVSAEKKIRERSRRFSGSYRHNIIRNRN